MDLKYLETFIKVCKLKSFSKAAKYLYLSQPTVSNHIIAIEEELKTSLIDRSSKNLVLTPEGIIFLDFCEKVINEKTRLTNNLLELSSKSSCEISIAASSVPLMYILPNLVNSFSKDFLDTKYKIRKMDSLKVVENIENKLYTFGFCGYKAKGTNLEFCKIAEDEMVLIEGKEAKIINKNNKTIKLEDILDKPFIDREEGSGIKYFLRDILEKGKIHRLKTVAEVDSIEIIKQMVQNNMGISFISKHCLSSEDLENFNIYYIENAVYIRDLYFVYRPDLKFTVLEEKFKKFVINEAF